MDIISPLLVLGINYQKAPVAVREKISFPHSRLREALHHLLCFEAIKGSVILSTCNRSEIYVSAHAPLFAVAQVKQFLTDFHKVDLEGFSPFIYCFSNRDVVEHLWRVSSGLESQVIGENEILGQVKRAFGEAKAANATDSALESLFEKAIAIGKKVRKETAISQGSISLGSMAIKLAEKRFNLKNKTILLVGVNKINEHIARYLYERNIHTVIVANRTYEKALVIAHYLGGKAMHFDQFKRELHQVDIIISSTAAPHLILKREEVEASLNKHTGTLLIIDLAVPRDVDPEIRNLAGVTLYDLDDFNQVIKENIDKKREEALKAEGLIDHALQKVNFLSEPLTSAYHLHESTL